LALPDDVGLPDPGPLVALMVQRRHPTLPILNTEATPAALLLQARMVLSAPTAGGQLADVLSAEGIAFQTVDQP
jgi:hypothetical protein